MFGPGWKLSDDRKSVTFSDGGTATFPHPILRVAKLGTIAVVMLKSPPDGDRNLYGVKCTNGIQTWQIDPRPAPEAGPYAALVVNLSSGSDEPEVLTTSASGHSVVIKAKHGR